jgi:hypothetical protein
VKTRRRAIAIEQTLRQSRAFNAPKLQGCSVSDQFEKNILVAFQFFAFLHTQGHSRLGRGKLQVQPCPQCPVSDGRPEKGGLSLWANHIGLCRRKVACLFCCRASSWHMTVSDWSLAVMSPTTSTNISDRRAYRRPKSPILAKVLQFLAFARQFARTEPRRAPKLRQAQRHGVVFNKDEGGPFCG